MSLKISSAYFEPSSCPCLLPENHHNFCAREIICVMPERLLDNYNYTYHHEVPQKDYITHLPTPLNISTPTTPTSQNLSTVLYCLPCFDLLWLFKEAVIRDVLTRPHKFLGLATPPPAWQRWTPMLPRAVFCPLLFTLQLLRVKGLISNNDESECQEVVNQLAEWYRDNNISPNINKCNKMFVDCRRTE